MKNWLNIYSEEAWSEAVVKQGRTITGFPERKWRRAQDVQIGDRLLCYMIGGRGFFATMEVDGDPYRDDSVPAILHFEDAFWIPWKLTLELPDETGIRPPELSELSWIKGMPRNHWTARVRQTLVEIDEVDAQIILTALQNL